MTAEYLDKPLFSLTVREFLSLQTNTHQPVVVDLTTGKTEEYEYGIAGIARIFGCSIATAQRMKSSGLLNKAIQQVGRTIAINIAMARKLAAIK